MLDHLYRSGTLPKEAIEAEQKAIKAAQEIEEKRIERMKVHNDRVIQYALANPLSAQHLLSNTPELSVYSDEQIASLQKTAAEY
jgi:hypothetical protein